MYWKPKEQRSRRAPDRKGGARYELPRAALLGGDALKGGHPCAPGHAGRTSLSFVQRLGTPHLHAAKRVLQAFAAALLLAVTQALAPVACSQTTALATSGTDPKTVTLSTEYRHQLDGQEAYCTVISVSPPPKNTVVSSWSSGPLMLDYVLYHSEGGYDVQYSWEPARYAVWAIMHNDKQYLTTYGSGDAMPAWFSNQVKALYTAAENWVAAGATGPERGCSRVYAPSSSEYQPLAVCVPQLGDVQLSKASALPAISADDACYSLAGAEYTLYADEACTNPMAVLTTDEDGTAEATSLSQGTYYARETKAPAGFARNETTYKVNVLPLEKVTIADGEVLDQPLVADVGLLLRKCDSELLMLGSETQAQGDASLAGAQFVMTRYANTAGETSGEAVRTWTIQTDEDGIATLDDAHLVAGDELYRDVEGTAVLPLGTYTIDEVASPEGYLAGDQSCCFVVEQQGTQAVKRVISGPTRSSEPAGSTQFLVPNDVIRGGVRLGKVDAQRFDHVAQGSATLEGAVLAIELTSEQPVIVGGITYAQGSVVTTLTTGADGCAETSAGALPFGSYVAYEVEAPEGYQLTGREAWCKDFQIREDGVVVDLSDAGSSVPDQVKRGDLAFVKVDGQSMRRMAGVPFAIESLTTGERHVMVTDDNGQCSTSADFNAHSYLTNVNDGLEEAGAPMLLAQPEPAPMDGETEPADADPVFDAVTAEEEAVELSDEQPVVESASESSYDASAGIWFSGGTDVAIEPDDSMGALPYDTYRVSELRCAANEGYDLVSFEIRVSRDHMVIDGGTVDDHALPALQTTLATMSSSDGGAQWQLADTVYFNNLVADGREYELRGTLHLVAEDGSDGGVLTDAEGNAAATSLTFRPSAPSGSVDVMFAFDADLWRGQTVVAFEELWLDGELLASHADITDPDQSVTVPRIGTELTDGSGTSEVLGTGEVELIDTVTYEGLVPGKTYQLTGTLMDKGTGEPVLRPDGTALTAQCSLTPDTPSGTAVVTFVFDGSQLLGHTMVAYESLSHEGVELAAHTDIADEAQSVTIPGIRTVAGNALDGSHLLLGTVDASIVDTVSYQGLVPGSEYALRGTLVSRATGEPILAQGEPIQSELSFTPEGAEGSVEMAFTFDATALCGSEVTVLERLYHDDALVALHEDLSSDDQSLSIPRIETLAASSDGRKVLDAAPDQHIIDTVFYEGLEPGADYLISGVVHVRDAKGNDAGPLLDANGDPVAASAPLVPEASSGEASLGFDIDTSELGKRELVVFELLMNADTDVIVATHEDISDGGQTVTVSEPTTPPSLSQPPTKQVTKSSLPKMGDMVLPVGAVLTIAACALCFGGLLRILDARKERRATQRHSA